MRLKVHYFNKEAKGGADFADVEIYFKPDQTGGEAITQILKETTVSPLPTTEYTLFHTKSALWIKHETNLASICQDDDLIELKMSKDVAEINFALNQGTSSPNKDDLRPVLVDFSSPLKAMIPYLTRIFHLNKAKEEYCFRKIKLTADSKIEVLRFVNSNLSLKEQNIKAGSCIVLLPLSIFLEKSLDNFSPNDITKSGWIFKNSQKGDSKPTGIKKRWCVLADHFLFYFPDTKGTSKPNGVVNLEHMSITYENNNIKLKTTSQSFKHMNIIYNFFTDKEQLTKEWSVCIRQHCSNGDPHRIFGVPLTKLFKARTNIFSPFVKSINYIDSKALEKEKLFQIKGDPVKLNELRDEFDRGKDVDLNVCEDPYVVADLHKAFVKEIPDPLLTFELFEAFLNTKPELARFNELIAKLPVSHQIFTEILLHFIARLLNHKAKNGVEWDNISVIYGPVFLRPQETFSPELSLKTMPTILQIIKFMVSNRQLLVFPKKDDGKHEYRLNLKNESYVKALYDYQSKNQTNAQGESDLGFKKDQLMEVIDERGTSGWIKVRISSKEGLVPRNYVSAVDPSGIVEIIVRKKGKRKSNQSKRTLSRKGTSRSPSTKTKKEHQKEETKESKTVDTQKVLEDDYQDLQNRYESEVKKRQDAEEQLGKLRAEFEDYKMKFGPPESMDLPPPPSDLPPPPSDLPPLQTITNPPTTFDSLPSLSIPREG